MSVKQTTVTIMALLAGILLCSCGPGSRNKSLADAQVHVSTTPADAKVSLDGAPPKNAPATFSGLEAGIHFLKVEHEGFEVARKTIRLDPHEKTTVEINLTPLKGLLVIRSTPPDAEVEVDGVHIGVTPMFTSEIAMGARRITLTAPGFLPRTVEINVADRRPQQIDVDLRSDSAKLVIESTPPGATIILDASTLGVTPMTLDRVTPGKHTLEIVMDGYNKFETSLELKIGEERDVRATLKTKPAFISITSIPTGARFFIDDAPVRAKPGERIEVAPGTREIRAELKGYERATLFRELHGGEDTAVEIRLVKNSGILVLTTQPTGVAIFIDGEAKGATTAGDANAMISEPFQIDLLEKGTHKLQLTKQGFFDHQKTVEILPNRTVILHEKLKPRPVEFIPDVIIRTGPTDAHVFRGVIREEYDNGEIKVETSQGIFQTFRLSEIRIEKIREPMLQPADSVMPQKVTPTPPKPADKPAPEPAEPPAPQPPQQQPKPPDSSSKSQPAKPANTAGNKPAAASTPAVCYEKKTYQVKALTHGQRRLMPGTLFELQPMPDSITTPDKPVSFHCSRQSDAAAMASYAPCTALLAKPNAAGEPQLLMRYPPLEQGEAKIEKIWPVSQTETRIVFPPAFDAPDKPPANMRADAGRAFFFLVDLDTGKPLSNIIELTMLLPKTSMADMIDALP